MGTIMSHMNMKYDCESSDCGGGGGNGAVTPPLPPSSSCLFCLPWIYTRKEAPEPSSRWDVIIKHYRPVLGGVINRFAGRDTVLLTGLKEEDDIDEKDIFIYFFKTFGREVHWVEVGRDPTTKKSCRYAMLCLQSEVHGLVINRRHVIKSSLLTALPMAPPVDLPIQRMYPPKKKEQKSYFPSSVPLTAGPCTIYVGGFTCLVDEDGGVDEDFIGSYFSMYGSVKAVELPRFVPKYPDACPCTCRWALVLFADSDSADQAVLESPHTLDCYRVVVHPTDGRLVATTTSLRGDFAEFEMGDDRDVEEYKRRGTTQLLEQESGTPIAVFDLVNFEAGSTAPKFAI